MDAQAFWNVIGQYNQNTIIIQVILLLLIVIAVMLSYTNKVACSAKLMLGIANLFIGIIFFGCYGTQPIQKYFAFPLYLICGFLFLYEGWHNKNDVLERPNIFQMILLLLYCLYPLFSLVLGNRFPQMVTHIMPCPIVSLSLAVYAGYKRKNKLLILLLTIWGLTGIKSVIFAVYEDIILLVCGIYGVYLLVKEIRLSKSMKATSNEF
ncbi:MAG: DUF6064 family protein [Lachnospiraceae bacterium]